MGLFIREEPWHQPASRRKHNIERIRQCDNCGMLVQTVEFHETRGEPVPESTPDRCPECIVGPGRVIATRYPGDRYVGKGSMLKKGAVVRARQCACCKHRWATNEMYRGGRSHLDITRCSCGHRMRVKRRA